MENTLNAKHSTLLLLVVSLPATRGHPQGGNELLVLASEECDHGTCNIARGLLYGETCADQFQHLPCDFSLPLAAFQVQERLADALGVVCGSVHGDEPAGLLTGIRFRRHAIAADERILAEEAGKQLWERQITDR